MKTHSSILAWRITWIEESGGLQSMELQRVGHDLATFTIVWMSDSKIKNIKHWQGYIPSEDFR